MTTLLRHGNDCLVCMLISYALCCFPIWGWLLSFLPRICTRFLCFSMRCFRSWLEGGSVLFVGEGTNEVGVNRGGSYLSRWRWCWCFSSWETLGDANEFCSRCTMASGVSVVVSCLLYLGMNSLVYPMTSKRALMLYLIFHICMNICFKFEVIPCFEIEWVRFQVAPVGCYIVSVKTFTLLTIHIPPYVWLSK